MNINLQAIGPLTMPLTKFIILSQLYIFFANIPAMAMDTPPQINDGPLKIDDASVHITIPTDPTNKLPEITDTDIDPPKIDDVNLDEDIPGCTDNCLRGLLKGLRIFQGPIDLAAVVTTSAAGLLNLAVYAVSFVGDVLGNVTSANATGTSFVREHNQNLIAAAALLNGVSASLQLLRAYWQKAIHEDQELLRNLILEERAKNK